MRQTARIERGPACQGYIAKTDFSLKFSKWMTMTDRLWDQS